MSVCGVAVVCLSLSEVVEGEEAETEGAEAVVRGVGQAEAVGYCFFFRQRRKGGEEAVEVRVCEGEGVKVGREEVSVDLEVQFGGEVEEVCHGRWEIQVGYSLGYRYLFRD